MDSRGSLEVQDKGIDRWSHDDGLQISRTRGVYVVLIAATAIFGAIISLAVLSSSFTSIFQTQSDRLARPCGRTPSEAQRHHCNFDVTSRFWVPEECFYSDLVDEFRATKRTPYYADANGTQVVTDGELPHYTGVVYTTPEYHRLHCMFLLRRNHLAVRSGGKLPALMTSYEHTEHCLDALVWHASGLRMDEIHPIFDLQFPPCVKAREALNLKGELR